MPGSSVPSPPAAPAARPTFADVYDRVVGRDFWAHWWRAFDRAVAAHGLRFESVCEVACGTAEIARRFAAQGHAVWGVDISGDMIRVAEAKCRGTGVRLKVQAMEALTLERPVDLIVCCYDSLNRLPTLTDLETTFARFRAVLAPGGHVVCDLATLRHLARDWGNATVRAVNDGVESVWQTAWEPRGRRLTVHLTAFVPLPRGSTVTVTERALEYGHPKAAVEAAMARAGLTVIEVRDMIPWTPGTEAAERLFYVLRAA